MSEPIRAGIAVISGGLLRHLLHLPTEADIVAMWPNDDGDLCVRVHHDSLPVCEEGKPIPQVRIVSERIESHLELFEPPH